MALAAALHWAQVFTFGFSALRSHSCECVCRGDPSEAVLTLLGEQLRRCGPEQLARSCPPEVAASWLPGVSLSLLLLAAGFIAGAAAATLGIHRAAEARFAGTEGVPPPLPGARPTLALAASAPADSRGPLTPAAKRSAAATNGGGSVSYP